MLASDLPIGQHTHQGIDGRIPTIEVETPPASKSTGIRCRPILNGLHHHYFRKTA